MHTLIATRCIRQEPEHPLRVWSHQSQLLCLFALAIVVGLIDKHAAPIGGIAIAIAAVLLSITASQRALGEVQMHGQALELVVVDLVEIVDGAHKVGANVTLLVERLETTPYAHILVQGIFGFGILLLVSVDPFLDIDGARAVVETVRDVGGLGVYGANLADNGDLRDGVIVDGEVGAGVGFFEVEELLDGDGPKRLV